MGSELRIDPNPDTLAIGAADQLVVIAASAITERKVFRVALSGGSTPQKLYSHLTSGSIINTVDWEQVHFFWSDERHVPDDNPESNYRIVYNMLLKHLPISAEQINPIRTGTSPEQGARGHQKTIKKHYKITDPCNSSPRFDLILLGWGMDGHTASLFPHTPALAIQDQRVVANYIHSFKSWRITFTSELINAAANVQFLVVGEKKAERLNEVINGPYQPENQPAQLIKPDNGRLTWLIDEAAASGL